jgi:hypothetical protein
VSILADRKGAVEYRKQKSMKRFWQQGCGWSGALLGAMTGLFACASFCHAQSPVMVQLSSQKPGAVIAPDFVGLSFEMQMVLPGTNGDHFFSPQNKALIAMFKTLGIRNLRVGGNTADRPTLPTPSIADVDNLFAFAKAADVKLIYTLRLNQGSLAAATEMVNYITRHYAKQLDCFAIGNEPNVFSKEYTPYLAEWKRYAAGITASTNSPAAKFCGPSTSPGHESWAGKFASEFGQSNLLAFIAQHDYPGGDARRATNSTAALDKILSAAIDEHYAKFSANFVPAIFSNKLPYRLEEANSFYDGGASDVSDTFASALWALDYQWWWAAHGASGINFHTGNKVAARDENKPCRYAVFWTSAQGYHVHPIGYALKMFASGTHGALLFPEVENKDNLNVAVYAAAESRNDFKITLINREHGQSGRAAEIVLNPGFARGDARALFLVAPENDVAAKTGITLGGAEIRDDATWRGKWEVLPGPGPDGQFTLKLPPASAALVEVSPR